MDVHNNINKTVRNISCWTWRHTEIMPRGWSTEDKNPLNSIVFKSAALFIPIILITKHVAFQQNWSSRCHHLCPMLHTSVRGWKTNHYWSTIARHKREMTITKETHFSFRTCSWKHLNEKKKHSSISHNQVDYLLTLVALHDGMVMRIFFNDGLRGKVVLLIGLKLISPTIMPYIIRCHT